MNNFQVCFPFITIILDVFSLWALKTTVENLPKVAKSDSKDKKAKEKMLLASTFAGYGFGTAGVHCKYIMF